jgi:hypothetical protein
MTVYGPKPDNRRDVSFIKEMVTRKELSGLLKGKMLKYTLEVSLVDQPK